MLELENLWQSIPISERDRAYAIFHAMKDGEILEIDKRVKPENRDKFLTICKYFIKWEEGINFVIAFSEDETKIKKMLR